MRSHQDENGHAVIDESEILDIGLVPDDHDFGYGQDHIPDDGIIHIEGDRTWRDTASLPNRKETP